MRPGAIETNGERVDRIVRLTRTVSLSVCWRTVVCVCGAAVLPARAQTAAGEITGIVKDQAGAAVPGATITVTAIRTNLQRVVISTGEGVYTAASLAPGEYRLDIELAGSSRCAVRAFAWPQVRRRASISISRSERSRTGDGRRRRADRARRNREPRDRRRERTGRAAAAERPPVHHARHHRAGRRPAAEFGPAANQRRQAAHERVSLRRHLRAAARARQVAYYPIIDAIQEFKIESNSPPAEFGRFNGGVVNLTTKSGGNAFHGNLFEFFRNEHLNARNYFQPSNPTKPEYRRNQYGGMLGGPVVKDGTFFFVDYQGQRQRIGRTVTSTVPTLAERSGVFRQNIYDPATTVGRTRSAVPRQHDSQKRDGSGRPSLLDRYPLPTSPAPRTTTAGRRTKSTIRTRETCASITGLRPAATRRSGA